MRICAAQPGFGRGNSDVAFSDCGLWYGCGTLGCFSGRDMLAGSSVESEKHGATLPAIQRKMEPAAAALEKSEVAEYRLGARG